MSTYDAADTDVTAATGGCMSTYAASATTAGIAASAAGCMPRYAFCGGSLARPCIPWQRGLLQFCTALQDVYFGTAVPDEQFCTAAPAVEICTETRAVHFCAAAVAAVQFCSTATDGKEPTSDLLVASLAKANKSLLEVLF